MLGSKYVLLGAYALLAIGTLTGSKAPASALPRPSEEESLLQPSATQADEDAGTDDSNDSDDDDDDDEEDDEIA